MNGVRTVTDETFASRVVSVVEWLPDRLPQQLRAGVGRKMTAAYHPRLARAAQAALLAWVAELDRSHPRETVSAPPADLLDPQLEYTRGRGHHARLPTDAGNATTKDIPSWDFRPYRPDLPSGRIEWTAWHHIPNN